METGLFYIGQPDLDLIREPRLASALVFLLVPPEYYDYSHAPPLPVKMPRTSTLGEVRVSESLYIASVQPVL